MKVVCESCQAKYQVPDERVAGKKLKIRCKRCGAIVLIRGDLDPNLAAVSGGSVAAESLAPVTTSARAYQAHGVHGVHDAPLEWHVSLEGDTQGPFDTAGVRAWLDSQPGGWDAHVWREGFPDWMDARACTELAPPPAVQTYGLHEDEGPTQTFQAAAIAGPLMAEVARSNSVRNSAAARGSSVRTRSGVHNPSSPRIAQSNEALTGERHEDSVLFSTQGLQTMTSTPAYVPGPNPGFANGEGSGLIDIRALASLARQSTSQIAPGAAAVAARSGAQTQNNALSFGNEDDDGRNGLFQAPSSFGRIDSLAPVTTTTETSNVALPLAIVGGCALVAAAVLLAVLIARPSHPPEMVAVTTPQPSAAAQPSAASGQRGQEEPPEPQDRPEPALEPEAKADAPNAQETAPAEPNEEELATGKVKRQSHSTRTAIEEKKTGAPEEKNKPKRDRDKEEKAEPPSSLDEVMLADRAKPTSHPAAPPPDAAGSKTDPSKNSDVDSLLGARPTPKPSSKNRSIDDLLSGADKGTGATKPAAPAPAPAAAPAAAASTNAEASDLPASPSRDETLAAMRGVESAVRACTVGQNITGTAEAEIVVAGNTGRITSANVTGITGNVGSCIARAVRNARFPHFTKPTFSIKYPYRF
jgi:predicted Zn finger-like uncharacterized protein